MTNNKKIINKHFAKWIKSLGLRWWHIDVIYYHDPKDIVREFKTDEGTVVLANTWSDWRYGKANIHINLPAFSDLPEDEIETIVVHELVHVLVNEMREEDIDHEERVVTGLTKAFLWVREGV